MEGNPVFVGRSIPNDLLETLPTALKLQAMKNLNHPVLTVIQPNLAATPPALRYYDPELQIAWNLEPCDRERLERAQRRAKELHKAYLRSLTALAPLMSKRTFSLFSNPIIVS